MKEKLVRGKVTAEGAGSGQLWLSRGGVST